MTSGIAMSRLMVLIAGVGVLVLVLRLIFGRRRRRGGIVAGAMILLVGLAFFGVFVPRSAYSRARAEQARAQAERERALQEARLRQRQARNAGEPLLPGQKESSDADDEDEPSDATDSERENAAAEELQDRVNDAVDGIQEKVESMTEATVELGGVHIKTYHPPTPPGPPLIQKTRTQTGLPDRSPRAQIGAGILLAGVVLAGYFFLNANTRGHYTWQLRIGSTLVFIASLVIILLVTNCI